MVVLARIADRAAHVFGPFDGNACATFVPPVAVTACLRRLA
jgi:hypothetical protein